LDKEPLLEMLSDNLVLTTKGTLYDIQTN